MKELKTFFFILVLCSLSALILSAVSTSLRERQNYAKESYQNKELLNAANLLPPNATEATIQELTKKHLTPMLVDVHGKVSTFEAKGIDYLTYLEDHKKSGYYNLSEKLFFQIDTGGIIIPVNGFGLWDAIYGYIGISENGITISGISWYEQKETPGLGGEIQTATWQELFHGKDLFHGDNLVSFGITFAPKASITLLTSAEKTYTVDAISGATITTDGVSNALRASLSPYIPLLRSMQKKSP